MCYVFYLLPSALVLGQGRSLQHLLKERGELDRLLNLQTVSSRNSDMLPRYLYIKLTADRIDIDRIPSAYYQQQASTCLLKNRSRA